MYIVRLLWVTLGLFWLMGCNSNSTNSVQKSSSEDLALVKHLPVAKNQELSTPEDTEAIIHLEGEDDLNDSLVFVVTSRPKHGELSGILPNLIYTPHQDYNGEDSFDFKVNNGSDDSNEASVKITVLPRNDPPVAESLQLILVQDSNKSFTLSAYDLDSYRLYYIIEQSPEHGHLEGAIPELIYVPNRGYHGRDHFIFSVTDGNLSSLPKEVNLTVMELADLNVTISGKLTYDRVPVRSNYVGLDYTQTYQESIKWAEVVLLDAEGNVLQVTQSDENGSYSFPEIEPNSMVKVRVYAKMEQTKAPSYLVKVVDNTAQNALYALEGEYHSSGSTDTIRDLHATSGWNGAAYGATRQAAPFAIMDVIYHSMKNIIEVDANVSFPPLLVNWSVENVAATGSLEDGQIVTSHYQEGKLYILGDANSDTDEYDDHVIAHEWGHYYEDKFSRTDSLGGMHGDGDYLDIRVAFGEGFGNAISAISLRDPIYFDTGGVSQASGWSMDIEKDLATNAGWFSEVSVQRILYDLFDANSDGEDNLSMGFAPLHHVFIGKQRVTPAFTSIFSFIDALKRENNESTYQIDQIVAQEGIGTILDPYGENRSLLPQMYPYSDLSVGETLSICLSNTYGDLGSRNKLGNHHYIRFSIDQNATYELKAIRSNGSGSDPDFSLFKTDNGFELVGVAESPLADLEAVQSQLVEHAYLLDLSDWNTQSDACFDLSVEEI